MRAVVICVLVACSHTTPAPPRAAYHELEQRTAKIVSAMNRLVASLQAATDCPQMAFALRQFSRFAGEIAELGELRMQLSSSERERFDYDHEDDREVLARVHAAASRCMNDRETHVAYEAAGFWH